MLKRLRFALVFLAAAGGVLAQAGEFEVATIKRTPPEWRGGRFIRMTAPTRFAATNYTPRVLIAAAFSLNPQAVVGGPAWIDTDSYDVVAVTPGETRPSLDQQMSMLRKLLSDRFRLTFRREEKEMSAYVLTLARGGPKLKDTTLSPDEDPVIVTQLSPGNAKLPGRNASMAQFAAVMQRSIFDRPVLDKTGLSGRYDFDLEWTPDETQFGGVVKETPQSTKPPLFTALQEQLGLKLESMKAPVLVLAINNIERPSEN
jgi:uncharacterized protein (TIGR03435 family)